MTEYISVGGPCRRQCDVDKKTLVCKSCGMSYKKEGE
jgi:predicted Fe-S protein YdhL (DUF1289 family)